MARKIPVKIIVQLKDAGISQRMIACTRKVSRNSVSEVFRIADSEEIHYQDISTLDDAAVYKKFFPNKDADSAAFAVPDYEYIHNELRRKDVTMALLYQEYLAKCNSEGLLPVGKTKFYDDYDEFTRLNELTNHLDHKPGEAVQVDWAGDTMHYTALDEKKQVKVYLFVAALPYSMHAYLEPCGDMKMDTFILAQVHMFNYFGGVTRKIICDNLKAGVVEHPREGEIVLTDLYESFGEYYCCAIMPAGVRKPKQKSSAEGSVNTLANSFIGATRNKEYHSLEEIKEDARKWLEAFNRKPFQKREGSRYEVFMSEEKGELRALPPTPFEITHWEMGYKVQKDFHVRYRRNSYSCPYQYYRKKVDLLVSSTTLTIYYKGARLTSHPLFPSFAKNKYSTHPEDMPPQFQNLSPWTEDRYRSWAKSIGPHTSTVIDMLFRSVKIPEQAYNSCHAVLTLSKKYSPERLETSCEIALSRGIPLPRYRILNTILSDSQDIVYREKEAAYEKEQGQKATGGFLRGSSYYQNASGNHSASGQVQSSSDGQSSKEAAANGNA